VKIMRDFLDKHFGPGSSVYTIFKACRRCVYAKSHEPVLIYSKHRGPRVIVNLEGKTYVRTGECIGFKKCGKCFEAVKRNDLPCKWKEL